MGDKIEFVVVRHGQTDCNIAGVLQGQIEGHLDELGREQARAAAVALRDVHFDACYASDLIRAMDTAKIALGDTHPGVEVTPTPSLREWDLGILEGRLQRELLKEHPEVMAAFRYERGEVLVPGGEAKSAFKKRVADGLNDIALRHRPGQRILLVTHGGTLQMILRTVVGDIRPGNVLPLAVNASISTFSYFPEIGGWQLESWNSTSHLAGLELHPTLAY